MTMRKGDLTTPMFMWFVGIITAIILVTWYIKSANLDTGIEQIDEDIKNIHYDLNVACQSHGMRSDVRLYTDKGNLTIGDDICITRPLTNGNVTRCVPAPCSIGTEVSFDIASISVLTIEKTTADDGTETYSVGAR